MNSMEQAAAMTDLSAHEHRIALQAAGGVSNQAIGDDFGVSARAVEHHLTSAYRKLGIQGRDQLRRALREYAAGSRVVQRTVPHRA